MNKSMTYGERVEEITRGFQAGEPIDAVEVKVTLEGLNSVIKQQEFVNGTLPSQDLLEAVSLLKYIVDGPPENIVLGQN